MKRTLIASLAIALGVGLALALRPRPASPEPAVRAGHRLEPTSALVPIPTPASVRAAAPVETVLVVPDGWGRYFTSENMGASPVSEAQARAIEDLSATTRAEVMATMAAVAEFEVIAPNTCTVKVALSTNQSTALRDNYLAKLGEIVGPEWLTKPESVKPLRRMEALLSYFGSDPVVFAFVGDGESLADSHFITDSTTYIKADGRNVAIGGQRTPADLRRKYGTIADRAFALSLASKS